MADSTNDSKSETSSRLFTAVFIAIIGVTLTCYIVGQGLNAGTSVYIDRLGGSATLSGIGAAVFSFAAIIGRLVSGPLADARGRLLVIVVGAIVLLVGVLGAAFSADINIIMLWRTLQGLGFSAVTTATATAAADVLPAERLGEGIGYYGLGQAFAMSVGPAIAIALVSTDPPENLFWGLSISAAISLALCAFCRYERNPIRLPETSTYRRLALAKANSKDDRMASITVLDESPAAKERESACSKRNLSTNDNGAEKQDELHNGAFHNGTNDTAQNDGSSCNRANNPTSNGGLLAKIAEPGALTGGIPMMVLSPAFGFGIFFVGLLGTTLGVGNAGVFYTLSAVSMIVVRVSSKAFMDRVVPIKLFAIAVASGLVCYVMLLAVTLMPGPSIGQSALFYIAGVFYGLCLGIALPVNQTVAVKNSPAERWGAANGLFMLLFDVGIGLASVVWGVTNDNFGFTFTICCVLALIAASFVAALLAYPPSAKRRQQ